MFAVMKTRPAGIGNGNADWMGSLSPALTAMPLKNLAVPGSHDSFSFWVDEGAPVGPDQMMIVHYLASVFRFMAKKVMKKWAMTQNLTFQEQLDAGIRYFDLRVSTKPEEEGNEVYFIHGLFGHKVRDCLCEIDSFLSDHSKEVIFLDFNHHYAMDPEHHDYLITMLKEVFGNKLCHMQNAVDEITLDYLWANNYQVLVFYHHPSAEACPLLWPGSWIPAPWANTTNPKKLLQFLETTLGERKRGCFHVSQAILTPRTKTVISGMVQGLREYLVERNLPTILSWVAAQKPGVGGVNIITSDFVELVDFANTVINLNKLLLPGKHERRPA